MPAHVFRAGHACAFWIPAIPHIVCEEYFGVHKHFASERSKHAKLTGGEPTNIPYAATKAKLSLSKRSLLAAYRSVTIKSDASVGIWNSISLLWRT